jgi:hypothetical protein
VHTRVRQHMGDIPEAPVVGAACLSSLQNALRPTPAVPRNEATLAAVGREAVACQHSKRTFGDDPSALAAIGGFEVKRHRVTAAVAGGPPTVAMADTVSDVQAALADVKTTIIDKLSEVETTINDKLSEVETTINDKLSSMETTLNDKITVLINVVTACSSNSAARSLNSASTMLDHELTALGLEHSSDGGLAPGTQPDVMDKRPDMAGVEGLFPRTMGDIGLLSCAQLNALEGFYRVTFKETGNTVNSRRNRFKAFIGAR